MKPDELEKNWEKNPWVLENYDAKMETFDDLVAWIEHDLTFLGSAGDELWYYVKKLKEKFKSADDSRREADVS